MTPEEIEKLPYRPCVGVMLVNEDGRVFVGQRIDRDEDAWQMPQGGIDPGETPEEAGLRELAEEISVPAHAVEVEAETEGWMHYELPHDLVPQIWNARFRGQEQKWLLLRFHGSDDLIDLETQHPEFSSWQWCAPDHLVERIVPFKREVYTRVLEEFRDRI